MIFAGKGLFIPLHLFYQSLYFSQSDFGPRSQRAGSYKYGAVIVNV